MGFFGLDISSYQTGIDLSKVPCDWVGIKYSEGTNYLNPDFDRAVKQALSLGKRVVIYHYMAAKTKSQDVVKRAKEEAEFFYKGWAKYPGKVSWALDYERGSNANFGSVRFAQVFMDYMRNKTGKTGFIYMSSSVTRMYDWTPVKSYGLWSAQYENYKRMGYTENFWTDGKGFGKFGNTAKIYQYTSSGKLNNWNGNLDLDFVAMSKDEYDKFVGISPYAQNNNPSTKDENTSNGSTAKPAVRSWKPFVEKAKSYLGVKEGTYQHKGIITTYNLYGKSHGGLPRGYEVKMTDSWCATFVSTVVIDTGNTDLIPIECGCPQMINLADKMGIWVEDENVAPKPGWIVLYDWNDGDDYADTNNRGVADHIGIVVSVDTAKRTFTVVEGNYQDSVKERTVAINGRYLRGFIRPAFTDYDDSTVNKTIDELAQEVLDCKWGKGENRVQLLTAAYDAETAAAVQKKVNEILSHKPTKTVEQLAREVIDQKWGKGEDRKRRLEAAGDSYTAVQDKVNELLNVKSVMYTIKRGDTLNKIAAKYGTTADKIMALNKSLIKDKNKIVVGWRIRVK